MPLYTHFCLCHTHTPLTTIHTQLLQLQQATQGATANNSFGLGTSLGNSKPSETIHNHLTSNDPTPPLPPRPSTCSPSTAVSRNNWCELGTHKLHHLLLCNRWVPFALYHVPHLLSSSSLLSTPPFPLFFVLYHISSLQISYSFSSHPPSSSFPSIFAGLGNLGSAALGAATSPSQKSLGMGGLTNDTILQVRRGSSLVPRPLPPFFFAGEEPGYEANMVHVASTYVFLCSGTAGVPWHAAEHTGFPANPGPAATAAIVPTAPVHR